MSLAASKDTEYNGWANYTTWLVNLWISNDQGSQQEAERRARYARREATKAREAHEAGECPGAPDCRPKGETCPYGRLAINYLADSLKEWVEVWTTPDESGLATDLIGAALADVDWREIASHYLEDSE